MEVPFRHRFHHSSNGNESRSRNKYEAKRESKEFRACLESIGFKFNPYDPCVANRMVQRLQHTIRIHVDHLRSSHKNADVNTRFSNWLNEKYGKFGEVVATRGKVHDYLGMVFDYRTKGKVKIDMSDYVKKPLMSLRKVTSWTVW